MSRPLQENDINRVLRDGLQAQPLPQPEPDFDDRVLKALRSRRPWWQSLWFSVRPVVSTAACSMVVMLAILHWGLKTPEISSFNHPAPNAAPTSSQARVTMAMLDKALDQPNLQFGTFARLIELRNSGAEPPALRPPRIAPGHPPEPRRRDGLAPHRDAILA